MIGFGAGAARGVVDYALSPGEHSASGLFKSAATSEVFDTLAYGMPEELILGGAGRGMYAKQLAFPGAMVRLPGYIFSVIK